MLAPVIRYNLIFLKNICLPNLFNDLCLVCIKYLPVFVVVVLQRLELSTEALPKFSEFWGEICISLFNISLQILPGRQGEALKTCLFKHLIHFVGRICYICVVTLVRYCEPNH